MSSKSKITPPIFPSPPSVSGTDLFTFSYQGHKMQKSLPITVADIADYFHLDVNTILLVPQGQMGTVTVKDLRYRTEREIQIHSWTSCIYGGQPECFCVSPKTIPRSERIKEWFASGLKKVKDAFTSSQASSTGSSRSQGFSSSQRSISSNTQQQARTLSAPPLPSTSVSSQQPRPSQQPRHQQPTYLQPQRISPQQPPQHPFYQPARPTLDIVPNAPTDHPSTSSTSYVAGRREELFTSLLQPDNCEIELYAEGDLGQSELPMFGYHPSRYARLSEHAGQCPD